MNTTVEPLAVAAVATHMRNAERSLELALHAAHHLLARPALVAAIETAGAYAQEASTMATDAAVWGALSN
jgi:hypothetical protein